MALSFDSAESSGGRRALCERSAFSLARETDYVRYVFRTSRSQAEDSRGWAPLGLSRAARHAPSLRLERQAPRSGASTLNG